MSENRLYTITAFAENSPGVLHRLTSTLTRRKINIESLTVSETVEKGISRFTIVINTHLGLIKTITKQIDRIIEITKAYYSEDQDLVFKEIALIRVKAEDAKTRAEVEQKANDYDSNVTYVCDKYVIVEKTGNEDEINSLYHMFESYGVIGLVRSGRIALKKEISI